MVTGTRLTLTLTPPKGDTRSQARLVISGADTMTQDDLVKVIKGQLTRYSSTDTPSHPAPATEPPTH